MCHIWEMCQIGEMCGRNAVATTVGFQAHSTLDIQRVSQNTQCSKVWDLKPIFHGEREKDEPHINIIITDNVRLTYLREFYCTP